MYLSLKWLNDFVNIPKKIEPKNLGKLLTEHVIEIDGVENQADKFEGVIVGKILEIKKHPNADRLQLVKVDIGKEKLNIVCGAKNIEVGQNVPVATIGAKLSCGIEIEKTEIRGEKSCGMLCAEDELGLGNDHSEIITLTDSKIGQKLSDYLKLNDTIFEVDNKSITNRPDLWGHYGMAREIAVFLNVKFNEYKPNKKILEAKNKNIKINVKIENHEQCPRYMAIVVDGIKVEDSPKWIKERLIAAGMRPINNIVDITNYVMLEIGQPLHAFDLNFIKNIVVRNAKKGEEIKTLDGKKRILESDMLVIANEEKPAAIAGVMGGENSEINEKTSSIVIESANFNPTSIRKTSQKLGLRTESSMRFEKSLDPNLCEQAITRTIELIKKICKKAEVVSELIDEKKFELNQGPLKLNLKWLEKKIGENIAEKRILEIMKGLGFKVKKKGEDFLISIPTWRATKDVSILEDLVEEIARIHGYKNLALKMPKILLAPPIKNEKIYFEKEIKNILFRGTSLCEVYNYSFVGENQLKKIKMDPSPHIALANPIASHQTLLRQSLIPNLLENVKTNQAKYDDVKIFEIGNVFFNFPGKIKKSDKEKENLPHQEKKIGIAIATKNSSFFELKGIVEYLFKTLDLPVEFEKNESPAEYFDKKITANIILKNNKKTIGIISKINSEVTNGIGIKKEVAIAELSLEETLIPYLSINKKYQKIKKYPPVIRDLAFVINSKILYNDIKEEIKNFNPIIEKIELFDIYQGDKLEKNQKSLAFHVVYQDENKTLTTEEVDEIQNKLIKQLENKFEAKIRNF